MTWEDAKIHISANTPPAAHDKVLEAMEKFRGVFEAGQATLLQLLDISKFLAENYTLISNFDLTKLFNTIKNTVSGEVLYKNAYSGIVSTMTFDELMELQTTSIEMLERAHSAKIREIEFMRRVYSLPLEFKAILALI